MKKPLVGDRQLKVRPLTRDELDAVAGAAPGGSNPWYGGPTDWNTNDGGSGPNKTKPKSK